MNARFFIDRQPWKDATDIYFRIETPDGRLGSARPVEIVISESDVETVPPMLTLARREADDALQSLMDELWKHGIRPSDIGTPGHLAATQAHLADFRALIAKTLDVKLL